MGDVLAGSVGIRTEGRAGGRGCRGEGNTLKKKGRKVGDRGRRFTDASLADVPFHNGLRSGIILACPPSLDQVRSLVRLW